MRNWPTVSIEEVAQVFDGPHATPSKTEKGPLFLGINCLDNGRLNLANAEHVSEADFEKWTRRVTPQAGDIVFSYETRLGQAAIIPAGLRCCLGRRMALVRTNSDKLDPTFFLYQYLSPDYQSFLKTRTVQGSTVDRLALKEFPSFPIALPPLEIQKSISKTLALIDGKIESNQRMNETLEKLAQTLFQQWFVAFEFPAKHNVYTDEKLDKMLAHSLWGGGVKSNKIHDLSNNYRENGGEFVDSELGQIPLGWQVGHVEEVGNILSGFAFKSKQFSSSGKYGLVTIKNVQNGYFVDNTSDYLSQVPSNAPSYCHLRNGDILLSLTGNVGRICFVVGSNYLLNQRVAKITAKNKEEHGYIYFLMRSEAVRNQLMSMAKGTAQLNLSPVETKKMKIIIPPGNIRQNYSAIANLIFKKLFFNEQQSRTLAALRDTLLPQLLSGRLTVRQAELLVAA